MVTRNSSYKRPHGGYGQTHMGEDYSPDEVEFMRAMERFKRVNVRPFPTWSEVLDVLYSLGYRKAAKSAITIRG